MKHKYLICFILVLMLIFFGLPKEIVYAKSGFFKYIPFVLIFSLLPFLLYKFLIQIRLKKKISLNIALFSIFIIGISFGIWSDLITKNELTQNGMVTKGVVFKKWKTKKYRSVENEWLYQVQFTVKGKKYHSFSETDYNNSIHLGDTLLIKYSKFNPEINTSIH